MKTDNSFKSDLFVSVVVPVHNAETYIDPFLHEVSVVLSRHFKDHEIIIVDNCSRDGTVGLVEKLQREIHNIQLYCLARRIGIDGAFVVGLEHSIGDVIVTMDPAWDPPERILDLIECYYKGNEIVYGLRRDRARRGEGRGIYECFARGFYKLYRLLAREDIPAELSTFRLLSRRVVNTFMENRDRYSLFAVIAAFTGIPYAILEYDRIQRSGAQAEVDYIDAFSRAIDLLLLSSKRPLRIMTLGSLIGAMISFLYGIYVFVLRLGIDVSSSIGAVLPSIRRAGVDQRILDPCFCPHPESATLFSRQRKF